MDIGLARGLLLAGGEENPVGESRGGALLPVNGARDADADAAPAPDPRGLPMLLMGDRYPEAPAGPTE